MPHPQLCLSKIGSWKFLSLFWAPEHTSFGGTPFCGKHISTKFFNKSIFSGFGHERSMIKAALIYDPGISEG
jgi:hypothetical protein